MTEQQERLKRFQKISSAFMPRLVAASHAKKDRLQAVFADMESQGRESLDESDYEDFFEFMSSVREIYTTQRQLNLKGAR